MLSTQQEIMQARGPREAVSRIFATEVLCAGRHSSRRVRLSVGEARSPTNLVCPPHPKVQVGTNLIEEQWLKSRPTVKSDESKVVKRSHKREVQENLFILTSLGTSTNKENARPQCYH
jgi:hypothetical protein